MEVFPTRRAGLMKTDEISGFAGEGKECIMTRNGKTGWIAAAAAAAVMMMGMAVSAGETEAAASTEAAAEAADFGDAGKITFCLDWTPNTNHTGIFVAQAKGYYADAGLDVQVVQPPENGAVQMCASGQAQFAVDAQDTITGAWTQEEPFPVTAVAAILQHNTSGIMTRAGEGMDTPKGLEGHTYSTWDLPTEQAMMKYVVEKDGGDFSKVTLIPNDITDEPAALAAKQTDAIWVFYGWGYLNSEVEGVDCDFWYFKDIDSIFDYYTPVIIANDDFLKDHADAAKAFLAATAKGYEYAAQNPDEAAQILIDADNTGSLQGSEELVKKSQEYMADQYIADAPSWGYIDEERWNGFYKWLFDNGLIEKDLSGTGFTDDYLPQ